VDQTTGRAMVEEGEGTTTMASNAPFAIR